METDILLWYRIRFLWFLNWTSYLAEQNKVRNLHFHPFPIFFSLTKLFYLFWLRHSVVQGWIYESKVHFETRENENLFYCKSLHNRRQTYWLFFGSNDSCLCLNYSTDKWKIWFSSDRGTFMLINKSITERIQFMFSNFGKLGNKEGLFVTISPILKAICDSAII